MFNKPKGTRDFLPMEMKKRRFIEKKLREVFESYNFKEILTPTFESFQLLSKKTGEDIRKQLFVFKDHGNREMGLRPEVTSSVVRFYLNELKNLPKPLKLYYFANCFRYENPQAGRYREFWQMGCELIGSGYPIADAEIINLSMDGLNAIGMDYEINIGHLGVLRGIFKRFNLSEDRELKIRRLIDKEDYKGLEDYLCDIESPEELREAIFNLLNFKGDKCIINELKEILRDYPLSLQALENLEEILGFVKYENSIVNFGIARGLDYYTGMVFEIYGKKEGARQVCGGGRYDNLIELFEGQPTPAVGFAYGFDRIMLNIDDFEIEEESILVVPVKKDKYLLKQSLNIADELRKRGKVVEVDLMNRRLNKALNYANVIGISKVIIIGERELEEGRVSLKDMKTGEQRSVKLEELESFV
ncbi:MAG TPA: histidine--tRNA ligase [Methanothermococcus okinawensis]|uniref:Histidine--tRNA ligase n=1 Tax=Methanothermococcus okinawensis TaxID=155863 RepID=A0A833DR68_9EURY|nr:histidine--tRNA ligase [Methanothermococcus okinawensis]